jgi:signal transduction histidine kinase
VGDRLGHVVGSPTHFYQLFSNLIRNCIKHCRSDRPVLNVRRLEEAGIGVHRYLVRDNGEGIPEADLEDIFTPFFKGKSGGTGIGLATVEKIVNLYGGEVRAYNNNGACFEFTISDYSQPEPGNNGH